MENLVVSTNKKYTIDKFTSQIKVITSTLVKKVLNVSASSVMSNADCAGGIVSISGKIKVDVIYLTFENTIEKASGEADFIEKQKIPFDLSDIFIFDNLSVADVNFSSNEIICSVTHNTEILGVYRYELPNLTENNDEIVSNVLNFNLSRVVTSVEDNFSIAEECETNLRDIQILKVNASAIVDDVVCSVDKIVVEGRVLSEMIYSDNGSIFSSIKEIEFKQEIAAENVNPSMKATAFSVVKNTNISFEESGDKYVLAYSYDIFAKSYIFEDYSYSVASDIFMLSNNVDIEYDFIEAKNYVEMIEQSESILSQTDITSIEDFDDIIGVFEPKIEIEKIENTDSRAEVLAKISAYALYKSESGIEKLDINENIKFEMGVDGNKFIDQAFVSLQIVSFKVKAGKEIEVVFKSNCHAVVAILSSAKFVKSYDVVSEKVSDDSAIKVYIARAGQTIFEVAKALNVKPEIIVSQNQIDDVFEAGQKVYVYSPINLL